MEYEIWCRKLRAHREEHGLTQAEVARGVGLSRSHYSAIEHGRTVINYTHMYNLAKFLKLQFRPFFT